MSQISAKEVMKLRNETGLSMMACKAALVEAEGDIEKATELLRKQLKGKMEKRTDRAAGEGRVAIKIAGDGASIVEVRAETDFTAKNEQFIKMVDDVAGVVLESSAGPVPENDSIKSLIEEVRISTGENCSYARGHKLVGTGFGSYVHHDGKTAALIQFEGSLDNETAGNICKHIVAAVPVPAGVSPDDVPEEIVEKERKFRMEQAMESGKPEEIAQKMVEGGMRKFYEEVALVEQDFVMDPSKKIKDLVGDAKLVTFQRWRVGE